MKPKIYIINKGVLGSGDENAKLGKGCYSVTTTVGLIEYEGKEGRRFMLVDAGMLCDWENIRKNIEIKGALGKITHILMTHWDQDHGQNIAHFEGAMAVSGIGTARIGTKYYGSIEDLYPEGGIEDRNITFINANKAHSRDEMIYIVDSENEGKVAFVGDLIFAKLSEVPIEGVINFDTMAMIDPFKKYLILKGLYEKHRDIKKVYTGHSPNALSYKEFGEYIKALESIKYREFLKANLEEMKNRAVNYAKIASA